MAAKPVSGSSLIPATGRNFAFGDAVILEVMVTLEFSDGQGEVGIELLGINFSSGLGEYVTLGL